MKFEYVKNLVTFLGLLIFIWPNIACIEEDCRKPYRGRPGAPVIVVLPDGTSELVTVGEDGVAMIPCDGTPSEVLP